MRVSELRPRQVQRLAKRVLETLPPPKRWWQFWRKRPNAHPRVREVWMKIERDSRYWVGDPSIYLDAEMYDVLRDCVEHGPFDMNEFDDEPTEINLN